MLNKNSIKTLTMALAMSLSAALISQAAIVEGIYGGPGVSLADTETVTEASEEGGTDLENTENAAVETGDIEVKSPYGTEIAKLAVPEDAQMLVLIEGSGLNAHASAYKREILSVDEEGTPVSFGAWTLYTETGDGKLGRAGLGKTVEGDEKTPVGIFKMNTPFGIKDAEEGFPENYIKVDETLYWVGDSDSSLYNKLVSTRDHTDFDTSKSEHLIDYEGYYNYCIDMGYNPEGTPYLGSALFLHCSLGVNTGGCIAIPEETMVEIMKNYVEGATYIAVGAIGEMETLY